VLVDTLLQSIWTNVSSRDMIDRVQNTMRLISVIASNVISHRGVVIFPDLHETQPAISSIQFVYVSSYRIISNIFCNKANVYFSRSIRDNDILLRQD